MRKNRKTEELDPKLISLFKTITEKMDVEDSPIEELNFENPKWTPFFEAITKKITGEDLIVEHITNLNQEDKNNKSSLYQISFEGTDKTAQVSCLNFYYGNNDYSKKYREVCVNDAHYIIENLPLTKSNPFDLKTEGTQLIEIAKALVQIKEENLSNDEKKFIKALLTALKGESAEKDKFSTTEDQR